MIVKQVVNLSPVDLVHRNRDGKVALHILPVVDAALEQVSDCELLQTLHGKCLTRTCLSVCEDCNRPCIEN